MSDDAQKEREILELRAELDAIRQKTARSEVIAQTLRDAQHQLDTHIDKFARMHDYAQRAFLADSRQKLYETIAEGVVDVIQLEVGAVLEVSIADQQLVLLNSVNFYPDKTVFPLPMDEWSQQGIGAGYSKNKAVCESPVTTQPWLEMGLSSVIFMPFYNDEHHITGIILSGIMEGDRVLYDFEPKGIVSPFMVYCQQMSGILSLFNAIDKANQAGLAKSRFLANLSHEIRTPMNAIIGMVQIAERTREPEEIDRCIRQIGTSSKHLLGLINDVLDISKIEDGKFKLSQAAFNLRQVIESLRISIAPLAEKKAQKLLFECQSVNHYRLLGDDMRLLQVLINLLGNAVKFTPERGEVKLDISEFSHSADSVMLQFSVTDTGIGIAPEFLERLFKPFEQADTSISRNYGGTGLGLAISQHIVELMGGHIRADSTPGQGTCFHFSLPFEIDNSASPAESDESYQRKAIPAALPDFSGNTILIVDDVKVNRIVLVSLLKETKIAIEEAENGAQSLEMVLASPPGYYSLVLMDMQMPVMDGCTATRQIRASQHPDASTLPIIAMTANVFKEDVQEVLDSGMNGHIGKPIDLQLVLDTIQKYVKKR